MAIQDKKFILIIVVLTILASCSKPTPPVENVANTGSVKQAQDQLLNDINQVVDSVATGSTGNSTETIPLPPIPPGTATWSKVAPPINQKSPWDLLKSVPGLTPWKITPAPVKKAEVMPKVVKLTQTYVAPDGEAKVEFSISLEGKIIKSVSLKNLAWSDIDKKIEQKFADAINWVIAGKTIEDAKLLSSVGWASLTTNAFVVAIKNM